MTWALLDGLPAQVATDLVAAARRRAFRRGEVVFHEGDPGDSLHLVDSGHLAARVTTPYGETATLRVFGPGDFFGELALLSPGPRNATIVALEPCETLVVHRDQLDRLRLDAPALERALVEALVAEVRRLSGQLTEAMYVPAPVRLARRLVELARAYPPDEAGEIVVPLTQDDLAGLCGVTRPTVNQLLGRLVERGLVALGRGRVVVRDLAGLHQRAEW